MSTPPELPTTSDLPGGLDTPGRLDAPLSAGRPVGTGPLADPGIITGGPIDDPSLADHANPRWNDPTSSAPDADPVGGAGAGGGASGGSLDPAPGGHDGTPQDQAAQELEGQLQVGTDNIREGRGDGTSNPAMAEGGDG